MAPPRTAPNPFLLLSLPVLAFGSYVYLVNKRAQENPASRQPRQAPNPLTPPIYHEDASKQPTPRSK
ncbi:hypothetical protein RHS03_01769, partial [Rhizoctonia solani]|uniref:Uncharacterized protein n=1 Tax=Rhizoctonia solani TaxID=456999 RepID=A0A8H7IHS1_9AGAM